MMNAKKKLTRLWSVLLVLVMLVGLLPTTALATGATPATATADFFADPGAALALLNTYKTGTADSTWDGNEKILTLNGVNFETTAATAVKLPDGAKIVLNGDNTITGGDSASEKCYGIYAEGSLTISGSGTLNVTGGNTTGNASSRSCGIYAVNGKVLIKSGTVNANGGAAGGASFGIYSNLDGASNRVSCIIEISGGTVNATGGTATGDGSFGINAEGEVIISGGEVKATGGTGRGSDGIYSGSHKVTINGGTVMAIGGAAPIEGWSVGIYANNPYDASVGKVTINGGTVTSAANYNSSACYPFKGNVTGSGYKTISFDRNGGSGEMKAYTTAAEYTLPANGFPAPKGKQLKCWNTQLNGTGTTYMPGDPLPVTGNVTLYAQWEDAEYTVNVTNGTASVSKATAGTTVSLIADPASSGQVFDKWEVVSGSTSISFEDANSETTFTMPNGNVSVKATYKTLISSVAITGIDAPVSNAALDTTAACATKGVSSTAVTWAPNDSNAQYSTSYTASVTLTAGTGYVFAGEVTATVNDNPASVTKNEDGTLTVTYEFPKTAAEVLISEVAITGIDAPVSNTTLDTKADCKTTGISNTTPTVTWDPSDSKAGYYKAYTASVTLSAGTGYKFADSVTATVNGNTANVTKNPNGTLTVTYEFPKTDKHNIEITVNTAVRGGDAATNPTISSGYEFEICFFVEDTDKDGVFVDKTTGEAVIDDKTFVVDEALVKAFVAKPEESFTYEGLMAAIKDEFDLDELKTKFTGGYNYSVYAFVVHSDNAKFACDEEDNKVTNATVKVNGKDITDSCVADGNRIVIMPGAYVFTVKGLSSIAITTEPTKTTYTAGESFDTAGMVVTATYSDGSTAAVTGYTVSPDRALTTGDTSVTISYTEGGVTKEATQTITVNPAASTGGVIIYTPPTYKVESEVTEDTDGSVSFSKNSAKKGDTVTITVTPDRYYKTSGVIVKDASGRMIAVTDNGNGTFTFQMPDSKVTVEPVFSWDNPFVDVAGDAYYAPAVEWALKNEVTDGTSDTTFSPDAGCTRAQIVTFLWRAAGCPEPAGMSSFTDVSADAYYAKAVAWAVEQGITGGTGGGKFSPDAVCTRGQIVTFLWRAEKSPAVGTANPFTDVEADAYYAGATNWAVENGITEGTGDGTTFSPANDCTRAQIVTFLYRFFVK